MAPKFVSRLKVAALVTPTEAAFNGGKDKGIEVGDVVILYRAVEIKDPDSGERLGGVEVPRASFAVNLVGDRYCVAKVTDRAPMEFSNPLRVRPLKTLTLDEHEVDEDTILIVVGENASVRREEKAAAEDTPF